MSKRKYMKSEDYEDDEIDFEMDKAIRKDRRPNNKNLLKKWQNTEDEYDDDFYSR